MHPNSSHNQSHARALQHTCHVGRAPPHHQPLLPRLHGHANPAVRPRALPGLLQQPSAGHRQWHGRIQGHAHACAGGDLPGGSETACVRTTWGESCHQQWHGGVW
eukprot:1155283-Pelagomonas_calceolata.AAC.1